MDLSLVWMNGDYVSQNEIGRRVQITSLPKDIVRKVTVRHFPWKHVNAYWIKILQPLLLMESMETFDFTDKNAQHLTQPQFVLGMWSSVQQRTAMIDRLTQLKELYPHNSYGIAELPSSSKKVTLNRILYDYYVKKTIL